jgi:CRISPR-associated endonuclease/helicase Cas3
MSGQITVTVTAALDAASASTSGGVYAHSLEGEPVHRWEPLSHHLAAVGTRAAEFAAPFGCTEASRVSGNLHDIGKLSGEFQAYIRGQRATGGDHSSAGARIAYDAYPQPLNKILAAIIAGHHAGLADGTDLRRRLEATKDRVPDGWEAHSGRLPPAKALSPANPFRQDKKNKGFSSSFLFRMLFSCLVDADFLETERFYTESKGEQILRGGHLDLGELRDRLRGYMSEKRDEAEPTALNALRSEILDHAVAKASLQPGLFTLTVPTGGGKTLTSLSFALEHAVRHGLRRVIYVIPYTSIIEQTAEVFRKALSTEDDVLEHHASFDWDQAERARSSDDEGTNGLLKLRRAAENWDVPIVVTTAVQFFESLYANRTSRCRKLHNIVRSVVILDEVQTIPVDLLLPCMAAIEELARNYGATIVLCTATQPALRKVDNAIVDNRKRPIGFDLDKNNELAPEPKRLYTALKRVMVERRPDPISDDAIAARFREQPQMLCIVNSRRHARDLFATIREEPGAAHLTTLMCPRHRRKVLTEVRQRLADGAPVRLVATSLIEAGIDIDFPEVWRAAAGLESIAQAAGRCNREGKPYLGRVVVFEPTEAEPPHELKIRWQAARPTIARHRDPLSLEAVRDYYRELYWQKGSAALDTAKIEGRPGVVAAIAERAQAADFPFEAIAEAFRVIKEIIEPVVVPWQANRDDNAAERLLARIAAQQRPRAADLRALQQYVVPITGQARESWIATGVLRPVHAALGDTLLRFGDLANYDPATGVRVDDPYYRAPEMNVIS